MTTSSNQKEPIFPSADCAPGVWSLLLASLPQPVDFRRVEGLLQTWMSRQTLEAAKAWAQGVGPGDRAPQCHRIQIAPSAAVRVRAAMDADRMVLATLTTYPFRTDLGGWPVTWVALASVEEVEQQVHKSKVQGVVVEMEAEGTPGAAAIQRLADRVPVLRVGVGAPQPHGVLPCVLVSVASNSAAGERLELRPIASALPAVEDWLFRAGHAALEASLARRSLRWQLACTHRWEVDSGTLVTEIRVEAEEKVRHVALSKDATPFAEIPDLGFQDVTGMAREKRALLKAVEAHVAWRPGDPLPPKGYLLTGPPGTGKTFLAKALAGEAKLPILALAAADLQTMWYGETERKIREVFASARQHRPAIIFFDEIDALAMRRDDPRITNPDVQASIVSTFLDCMDGFSKGSVPVLVLAATNHPDVLDPAFRRAGRFDRAIPIDLPGAEDREAYFRTHLPCETLDENGMKQATRLSAGLSFADLAQLVKDFRDEDSSEAGFDASHRFHEGLLRRLLGEDPKEGLLDEGSRRAVAVHEAGHAVAWTALLGHPPDFLSIRPRGRALGVTVNTKEEGARLTAAAVKAKLAVLLAGRVAETLFLPEAVPSAGAADDLAKATELALNAIGSWGLEPAFGLASLAILPESLRMALTPSLATHLNAWLAEGETIAVAALKAQAPMVEAFVEALLREGDLDQERIKDIFLDPPS